MKKAFIPFLFLLSFSTGTLDAQSGWSTFTDSATSIEFAMPPNTIMVDTLLTRLYAAEEDPSEAIQVHIFENALLRFCRCCF
jgi:hypothetical protein